MNSEMVMEGSEIINQVNSELDFLTFHTDLIIGRRDLTVNDIADIADIDDPILLLETLTRWDSRNINSTYASTRNNSQVSGSLQAAEMARASDRMRSSTPSSNNDQITRGSPARTSSKRRREGSEDAAEEGGEMFGFINAKAKPRKVRKLTAEEEEEAAREREIWGSEPSDIEDDEEGEDSHSKYSQIPDLNPRAHGVHSAAAIFRKTTAASRKYASKLFYYYSRKWRLITI